MTENRTVFRANLVQKQGQKAGLTYSTAPQVSWALNRLYPFLIIFDGLLSNLMWCCDDICLPFIYLVLLILVVNLGGDFEMYSNVINALAVSWLGLMSLVFMVLSCLYYISSVVRELKQEEPPTLDDIVVIMENVHYKLERMREDVARISKLRRRDLASFFVILVPFNWLISTYMVSARSYVRFLVVGGLIFHSSWCQCTLRLIWRSLLVRQLSFFLVKRQRRSLPKDSTSTHYAILEDALEVAVPKELALLSDFKHAMKFKQCVCDAISNGCEHLRGDPNYEWVKVLVVEYRISENQRKWPLDGWTHNTLVYERTKFSTERDGDWFKSLSPWEFQESLGPDWVWIDDGWRPHGWNYCDTEWNPKGSTDSLDCYTRTRIWVRGAFRTLSEL
ncbi:LAFA_0F17458g1_1 [Lachancea sp. 'fantastica']|nr:LAFA_0F17458g1_1 [Lachancea sp. 'fantastica']